MKASIECCQKVRESKATTAQSYFNTIFTMLRTWIERVICVRNKKPRISAAGKALLNRGEVTVVLAHTALQRNAVCLECSKETQQNAIKRK